MVDHEIDLRPVLRRLWQVVHIGIFPCSTRDYSFIILRQQSFMDADGGGPRLYRLVVERIDQLLVIEPPRVFRGLGLPRVADRVALPAVWLHLGDATVDLFHPAGLGRSEQRME